MSMKQFLALLMAAMVVIHVPLFVSATSTEPISVSSENAEADKTSYVYDGVTTDEEGTNAVYVNGSTGDEEYVNYDVTVNGDVIAIGDGTQGVVAVGGVDVTVNGDVETRGDRVEHRYTNEEGDEVIFYDYPDGVSALYDSTIEINGDVFSNNGSGVYAYDKSTVAINDGGVEAANDGVCAENGSTVNVGGNVHSENGIGVEAYGGWEYSEEEGSVVRIEDSGSAVTVGGDVISDNRHGVIASDGSNIEVAGNVEAGCSGAAAVDGSTVNVGGNVEAGGYDVEIHASSTVGVGSAGVYTNEDSTVNVAGNVHSKYVSGVEAYGGWEYSEEEGNSVIKYSGSTVTVGGDVISDNGLGVIAIDGSNVEVGGNVEAGGYGSGVIAHNGSIVNVDGNVHSENGAGVIAEGGWKYSQEEDVWIHIEDSGSTVTVGGDVISDNGNGVMSYSGSNIEVSGNVEAGGNEAKGVYADETSSVTVGGNVTAKGDGSKAVYADGGTITISGSVEETGSPYSPPESGWYFASEGVWVENAGTVIIGGNVSAALGHGICALDEGSTVTVKGDVTSAKCGIEAGGGSTVDVGGNVTATGINTTCVWVSYGSVVTVGGSVTVEGNYGLGMLVSDGGKVTVGGNVASLLGQGIESVGKSIVEVTGNVSGGVNGVGIMADASSTINVSGDVSSEGFTGLQIYNNKSGEIEGEIIIKGSVKGSGAALAIDVYGHDDDLEGFLASVPDIIVGKLIAGEDGWLYNSYSNKLHDKADAASDEDEAKDLRNEADSVNDTILLNKIKYIFADTADFENCVIKVSDDSKYESVDDKYYVACEGTEVMVTLTAKSGYEITSASGTNVAITKNTDGTYNISFTVERGGGISFDAIVKTIAAIETVSDSTSSISDDTASDSVEAAARYSEIIKQIYAKLYPAFQKEMQTKIHQIEANGTYDIDMGNIISFNRKTFEQFAKRPDVKINVTYIYMGHKYLVTIPAGYPVMNLLNEDGYCGCLYLSAIFGSIRLD